MIRKMRKALEQRKGERNAIDKLIQLSRTKIRDLRRELQAAEKAHLLIQITAQSTQEQLKYSLSELPKLALQTVFDNPYEFQVDFEIRRGKTEADFWFMQDGAKLNPKESCGLGAVDIAGTALRVSLWSLRSPRNRATIFLDEPFKHLKGVETNSRALAMLRSICDPKPEKNWPGIQIIMIADERAPREELIQIADRVFEFSKKNNQSIVKELK